MKVRFFTSLLFLLAVSCEQDNLAPIATFSCFPREGNIWTLFDLDAGASDDPDGLKPLLQFRWDTNGDGKWETPFGPYEIFSSKYDVPGDYVIRLEVMDSHEGVSSREFTIHIDSLHHMTDPRDGQVYPVVKLGSYWWMARNLNIGQLIVPPQRQATNGQIEKYHYPAADPDGLNGGLYSWAELTEGGNPPGTGNICPPGWRIPSDDDWRNMLSVFRWAANRLSQTYQITNVKFVPDQRVTHDNYQTDGAVWRLLRETGSAGFDVVPLGYCDPDGFFGERDYYFPGKTSTFWTSTAYGDYAIRVRLYMTDNHVGDVFRFADHPGFAFSVRCVKESL
ncbi:MAG: FISUMP domain-containing protein [Bacteroidales bacterium]|jgi:uncharacterized protein (TIGR02145 family)